MFDVVIDPEHQLMRVSVSGFWTAQTMADYVLEVRRAASMLASQGGFRRILINMSDYPVQSQDIAAGHARTLQLARERFGVRAAVVMKSALSRLQASRVTGLLRNALFEDEPSALAWLLGH